MNRKQLFAWVLVLAGIATSTAWCEPAAFPLKVSSNGRYLVDQKGHPFLIHGDSPWSLFTHMTLEEADHYLEVRERQGFNTLLVNVLDDSWSQLLDGTKPFMEGNDFDHPNAAYFDHVDSVMRAAEKRHFLMLVVPVYLGCCEVGWKEVLYANGPVKAERLGHFIGQRFARYSNVMWVIGGDRNPERAVRENPGGYRSGLNALASALHQETPQLLMTAHTDHNDSPQQQYGNEPWLTVDNIYTYTPQENGDPHVYVWADRERSIEKPGRPFFLIESGYENDGRKGQDAQTVRRQVFWAVLNGACGSMFGNGLMWGANSGWRTALETPGTRDMDHIKKFLDTLPWYDMEPDSEHKLLRSGVGSYFSGEYAASALTKDRKVGLIYLPTPRRITIDPASMSGHMTATWFSPATGKIVAALPLPQASGVSLMEFEPPLNKYDGSSDFVLVLKSDKP